MDFTREPIGIPASEPPTLVVVIDTEEEFDWGNFRRDAISVGAMSQIGRTRLLFEQFGVTPTYVVDYPVVSQPKGYEPLKELVSSTSAILGAHLHPWVTPPLAEELSAPNSYPGNLSRSLEVEKLRILTEAIEATFDHRPVIYKAGRYGFGPNTTSVLEELGYEIDLSVSPAFDYGVDGGPDYSHFSAEPYWFGTGSRLLGLPRTGAFIGFFSRLSRRLYPISTHPALRWAHLPGIFSRSGALARLGLTPEGYRPADLRRLTTALIARGVRLFSFCFHSTSLLPGCSPFVRNEADLNGLLDCISDYFAFFFNGLGGVPRTPLACKKYLEEVGRVMTS